MNFKAIRQIIFYMSRKTLHAIIVNCLLIGTMYASSLNAQDIKSVRNASVALQLNNATLIKVFKEIEIRTDYEFAFQVEDLNRSIRITASFENVSVADVLMEVSKQANLKFKQINNTIHISKKAKDSKPDETIEVIIQGTTITGKVISSEDNEGLPGVNVVVKGTTQGSITDVEGNYKLDVPDENSVLVFSSVGYAPEETTVGNRTVIDIAMVIDVTSLEEITVIGYGTQSKALVTNSISTVNSDQIVDRAVVSFTEALVGQVAGVQIQQTTGAGPVIKIRGVGTITSGGQPLYVVDGVPIDNTISTSSMMGGWGGQQMQNPMASINPNDIESINILKDASSTAIYGSRGSNGVIIITTKKGVPGKAVVSANVSYGMQTVAHKIDMMNTVEWAEMETHRRNWAWKNSGDGRELDDPNSVRTSVFFKIPNEFADPSAAFPDTDWQDEIFRVAPMKTISLSASGGTEKTRYYISGDYVDQEGVISVTKKTHLSFLQYNYFNILLHS